MKRFGNFESYIELTKQRVTSKVECNNIIIYFSMRSKKPKNWSTNIDSLAIYLISFIDKSHHSDKYYKTSN